jgi:CelD/BcsL family acetyltransferase involved in cellulose biosynthesis
MGGRQLLDPMSLVGREAQAPAARRGQVGFCVRRCTSLAELPQHYERRFSEITHGNYFLSPGWFKNFQETALESGARAIFYVVEEVPAGGRPRALLPMRTPAGQNGSILNGIWLRGRTLASMTNYQSVCYAPVSSPEDSELRSVMRMLVAKVCSERPRWSLIDLNLLDPTSPVFSELVDAFYAVGMVVRTYTHAVNIYDTVDGRSYAEFLKQCSSVVRKTYHRLARKLYERKRTRFEVISDARELKHALRDYQRVLDNSWKEAEPFPDHTPGMLRDAASSGAMRLGFLYVNDEPVATQIWIVKGAEATIYKVHYDQRFKDDSVGSILTAHMFEQAIDVDEVDRISFGVGDAKHKRFWLKKNRPYCGIVAFNPRTFWGVVALVGYSCHEWLLGFRRRIKTLSSALRQRASAISERHKGLAGLFRRG